MSDVSACPERQFLIQAEIDGELDAAASAELQTHLRDCPGCARLHADLLALSHRLRADLPVHTAPPLLRASWQRRAASRRLAPFAALIGGAAIAAGVMLLLPQPDRGPDRGLDAELAASHVRALQPGHLTDVLSSSQHTVKPWFDGRIDYAPPVRDFAVEGFPLVGGRLDYVGGRPVAVLVYQRDRHVIDLYLWPAPGADAPPARSGGHGYAIVGWTRDGMAFRAVSDVEPEELLRFAQLWAAP